MTTVAPRELHFDGVEVCVADPSMRELYEQLDLLARSSASLILEAETGSGKELAARFVHHASPRRDGPFVAVNCAALPETLAESELFGYERGAFTGAARARAGLLEAATGGTLFLDEIAELPASSQARLLRALDGGRVRRLGATIERVVDVRIVAATNRDLRHGIRTGTFRTDLYFRLGATSVRIPPLRDRPDDIPPLVRRFIAAEAVRLRRTPPHVCPEAMQPLLEHPWPGNVRQLRNVATLLAAHGLARHDRSSPMISSADVRAILAVQPDHVGPGDRPVRPSTPADPVSEPAAVASVNRSFDERVDNEIRERMIAALRTTGGNQTQAAALLHMPRRTFVWRMKRLEIPRPGRRARAGSGP
ncbi:MAG: sigma 54-interacting transcriptional regulator [Kofleriaceae bacterium]|nr:sigma 54-interacting transcriptional regulator [Kofleriaceae bacterium]